MSLRASAVSGLGTTAFAFAASLIIGTWAVARNDWFGSGDLRGFAIYCIPFAVAAWPLATLLSFVSRRWSLWFALPVAFALGLLYGYAATYALALLLGPWFGALSVPLLRVWCSVGALTFASVVLFKRRGAHLGSAAGVVALAAVAVAAFFGLQPALALVTGNQHLTVVILRHQAGESALTVSGSSSYLDDGDIALLKQLELRGTLEPRGTHASNSVTWPRAKALVVFTGALEQEMSMPQPKHCKIAFVQSGHGFRQVPVDAPALSRTIRFYRGVGGWYVEVEQASGARSGGLINP